MQINKESIIKLLKKGIRAITVLLYMVSLVGLIAGGISMGIVTLIPDEASKICYLGYYAHCSFTPFSTLILFTMAVIGLILLIKLIKYSRRKLKKKLKLNNFR